MAGHKPAIFAVRRLLVSLPLKPSPARTKLGAHLREVESREKEVI